jgi:DNA-binding NarL/FixJ family response regulator
MADKIRVILADDHNLVRQGIRQFLENADDIEVLGEASDGTGALQLVEELRPDIALLDIQMPGLSGVEVTRQIKARFPEVRILILTAYDDDPYVFALLQAGADGYLLKTLEVDDLLRAVHAVQRGESALSPEITQRVLRQLKTGRPAGAAEQIETLTARELEILRLAAQGLTNKAIGQEMGISDRTVQGHLANIYGKLSVASRTEAVTQALKRGWIVLT